MLNRMNTEFTVKLKKTELLEKLQENRKRHITMVTEAKEGYLKEAEKFLKSKLKEIRSGSVSALTFKLKVPVDYTSEYDSVIQMFTMHQSNDVELSTSDFNQLVLDQWTWTNDFITTNSKYSDTVSAMVGSVRF